MIDDNSIRINLSPQTKFRNPFVPCVHETQQRRDGEIVFLYIFVLSRKRIHRFHACVHHALNRTLRVDFNFGTCKL